MGFFFVVVGLDGDEVVFDAVGEVVEESFDEPAAEVEEKRYNGINHDEDTELSEEGGKVS